MNGTLKSGRYSLAVRQLGFSLLELLIALSIGLFFLATVAAAFTSTYNSFNEQSSLAQLQNNQLLIMDTLSNVLHSAGYAPYTVNAGVVTVNTLNAAPTGLHALPANISLYNPANSTRVTSMATSPALTLNFPSGAAVYGGSLYSGGPDVVAIQAQNATDCSGNPNTGATTATVSVLTVVTLNNTGYLLCLTNSSTATTYSGDWLVLASGVSGLNVWYGLDPAGTGSVTEYATAANVGTNWINVLTIKITISLFNPNAALPGQPATLNFTQVIDAMNNL
ncbi:MAG: PilW family protein [Methylomonas sp.]|jgi:type IV pilus assembly protein PilW